MRFYTLRLSLTPACLSRVLCGYLQYQEWGAPLCTPTPCAKSYLPTLLTGALAQAAPFLNSFVPIVLCDTVWCQVAVISGLHGLTFHCNSGRGGGGGGAPSLTE